MDVISKHGAEVCESQAGRNARWMPTRILLDDSMLYD